MMDYYGSYYYRDGIVYPAGEEQGMPSGELSFYEVIRTKNGVPLFFEDHMRRLTSGIATRFSITENLPATIRGGIEDLSKHELFPEINVKVTVTFTGQDYSISIFYIYSVYPTEEMYRDGVPLILYRAERTDPGVKLLDNSLRLSVNEVMRKKKAYEALLVNREGYITEGSRSNLFFVNSEETVYTAPDSMVLQGITRKYIIDLCMANGIRLVFKAAMASEISSFSSAFITGTSPMVLPVSRIGSTHFRVGNLTTEKLRKMYKQVMNDSISEFQLRNKAD